jgi:hypothetical protein
MLDFVWNYKVTHSPLIYFSDDELGKKIHILYLDKYSNVFTYFPRL